MYMHEQQLEFLKEKEKEKIKTKNLQRKTE